MRSLAAVSAHPFRITRRTGKEAVAFEPSNMPGALKEGPTGRAFLRFLDLGC